VKEDVGAPEAERKRRREEKKGHKLLDNFLKKS